MSPISLMGAGFIGSRYATLYPQDTIIEPRYAVTPTQDDTLFMRSTTDNYGPIRSDLHTDIDTNLSHLMEVLPNVRGRFCFTSSWFVYGRNGWGHHPAWRAKEEHFCNPNGLYSITKAAAEQLIRSYTETVAAGVGIHGPSSYQILRLSNVIGNDPRAGKSKNALEWLLSKVIANEETIPVYDDDGARDILHVDDVCAAIRLCIEKGDLNTIYNVGRGESHRMEDLIGYAIERTGSRSRIVKVPVPAFHRVVQVPTFYMDTTKLRSLGFTPRYSVYESVDRVLEGLLRRNAMEAAAAYTKECS